MLYIPTKEKYEWANSALRQKTKKKEAYISYMGKILKQVSWGSLCGNLEWPRPVIMFEALGVFFLTARALLHTSGSRKVVCPQLL